MPEQPKRPPIFPRWVDDLRPLVGRLNFARLAKPLRFPADNEFLIEGADGNVPVTSKLKGIEMGRDTIRFEFDVAVPPKR